MRILILTSIFTPEIRSQADLLRSLGLELQRRGHSVTVITKVPTFYLGNGAAREVSPGWDEVEGIRTLRVRGFLLIGRGPLIRAIEHLNLGWSFGKASRQCLRADILLIVSPPLPLAFVGVKYRNEFGSPFILNVQDLYPQTAIDLGLLRNRMAVKWAEQMEHKAYFHADRIAVHSPGNREILLTQKGVAKEKVHMIYNWVDTDSLCLCSSENDFRIRHRIEGKFVVSYAGLMGYAQDLTSVIECAALMRDEEDVLFLLVGEGVLEPRWKQMVKDRNLSNIRFLPLQPEAEYRKLLAASDLCLVPLSGDLRTPVVPGKLQSIMASGRPVVAAVHPEGDTPWVIQESKAGLAVEPEKPADLRQAIRYLCNHLEIREEMGRRAREFAEEHFSVKAAADAYESLFEDVLGRKTIREGARV